MAEWDEKSVQKIVINPIYTGLGPYKRTVDDEQWVRGNVRLIEEMGPEPYLRLLLETLREALGGGPTR